MLGNCDFSVIVMTKDSIVGEIITWDHESLMHILFLVLTNCLTLRKSFQLFELWSFITKMVHAF